MHLALYRNRSSPTDSADEPNLKIRGYLPRNPDLARYIRAIGIIKNLEIDHEYLAEDEARQLRIFRMRNKRLARERGVGAADYKERAVRDFVDHINACLEDNGRALREGARLKLAEYTGEIIANAEDHGCSDNWTIVGYLDNQERNHQCEIAIFNFGKTIAESFSDLDKNSYAWKQVADFVARHKRNRFFSTSWTEDDLLTLVALQGHISSKNFSPHDTRGQGTVDLIDFFQRMHKECVNNDEQSCARMAIVSGKTHILFDGKYTMKPDSSGRQVIAFNASNSLLEEPDHAYVRRMGRSDFPGTIISIRFPLAASQTDMVNSS